jgi:hypothetical protein
MAVLLLTVSVPRTPGGRQQTISSPLCKGISLSEASARGYRSTDVNSNSGLISA